MTNYHCVSCNSPLPETVSHRCLTCGGILGIEKGIEYDPLKIEPDLPGIWRFRHTFGLPPDAPIVSLGEGNTPLVTGELEGSEVFFKMESANPTGSFKDRLTAPLISYLKAFGAQRAVEDSSGNAGASFAAYAARAGIKAKVYLPASASGPKRMQIEAYGADVEPVPGPRSEATKAVLKAVEKEGVIYGSHVYLPQGIAGIATMAYEILEQLGGEPGTVIAPVGHGNLLLGIIHGFLALSAAGEINQLPNFIGVQAATCAPLWQKFNLGENSEKILFEGETVAEGIRVRSPVRGPELIAIRDQVQLQVVPIEDMDIIKWRDLLSAQGFYVEVTSAVAAAAAVGFCEKISKPIIVVLTGAGLKTDC